MVMYTDIHIQIYIFADEYVSELSSHKHTHKQRKKKKKREKNDIINQKICNDKKGNHQNQFLVLKSNK